MERLVYEVRNFRPQVVLTFGPDGLYGHPDHIAICRHATRAFHSAADPSVHPEQLAGGLTPHEPRRLFYSVRPRGFRTDMALKLREAGVDFPLPTPDRVNDGVPRDEIHFEFDVGEHLDAKLACIVCHRTQTATGLALLHRPPRSHRPQHGPRVVHPAAGLPSPRESSYRRDSSRDWKRISSGPVPFHTETTNLR